MKRIFEQEMIASYNRRQLHPFIPSVTNFVTAEFVVNCQLAVGASPAVLNLPDEACKAAELADAFYINFGTMLPIYEETIPAVAKKLQQLNKPWVLDPVAAGLGNLRTELLIELKQHKPSIVRGNASEIITLAKLWGLSEEISFVRGVDSTAEPVAAKKTAVAIAKFTEGAVAVSGETDLVTDGSCVILSHGGSPVMEQVTGCGCALGGLAAYCLSFATPLIAALSATNAFNVAGYEAAKKSVAPGSFKMHFIDALYNLSVEKIVHNSFEIQDNES